MKMHVCDICKRNQPDAKFKYKYRAKKAWFLSFGIWSENGWNRIELCQECLDKIIKAARRSY